MRAAAVVLLVLVSLIWCSQAVRKAERRTGNDLVGYLEASSALYAGGDPYHLPDRFPYIYPLFLAAVIRPLAAVPISIASVVWFALQAACVCFVLAVAASKRRELPVISAAIVAVFGDVLQSEFLNGQVNVIVLALVVAAVHFAASRPRIAGLLLGAAIAVKLTPALFLLYWVVERRYRIAIEAAVWAAVLVLAPWLIVQDRLWTLYDGYLREFILARTTTADPHAQAIFMTPYGFWGWLTASPPGRVVVAASALTVIAMLLAWHLRSARRSVTQAWVYAAATPLLSPMSEVHHLTLLIPAATATAATIRDQRASTFVCVGSALFVLLIWIARFDRTGPWYFASILCLIAAQLKARRESGGHGQVGPAAESWT